MLKWLKNYLDATKSRNVDMIVELIGGAEGAAKIHVGAYKFNILIILKLNLLKLKKNKKETF